MTGGVPYYGGRFTPAQAYAAAHPTPPPPVPPPPPPSPPGREDPLVALRHLLDAGVITQEEFDELCARAKR